MFTILLTILDLGDFQMFPYICDKGEVKLVNSKDGGWDTVLILTRLETLIICRVN